MRARIEILDSLHPRVRDYIETACSGVRKKRRDEIRAELASHALDVQEELARESLTEDQIAEKITTRLGDVMMLENQLAAVNRTPFQKWALRTAIAAVFIGSFALISWIFYTAHRINNEASLAERMFDRVYKSWIADQEALINEPFFKNNFSGRDIGEKFNDEKFLLQIEAQIPQDVKFRKIEQNFETIDFSKMSNFDPTWMKELKNYTHWDFLSSGANAEALANGKWGMGTPKYLDLYRYANARLFHGLKTKDVADSLEETYHLARLIYSSNLLIANMVGIGILGNAVTHYKYARENHLVEKLPFWERYSEEHVSRMKRVVRATELIFSFPFMPVDRLQSINIHRVSAGICGGLTEYLISAEVLRPVGKINLFSFEANSIARFRLLDSWVAESMERCNLSKIRTAGVQLARNIAGSPDFDGVSFYNWASKVPVMRVVAIDYLTRVLASRNIDRLDSAYH